MQQMIAQRRDMAPVARPAPVPVTHRDPAPSRTRYRLQRLWLTEWFRQFVRFWLPLGALVITGYLLITNEAVRDWSVRQYDTVRSAVAERPELMIRSVSIPEGSNDLHYQIAGIIGLELPVSSLDTDLAALRERVQNLSAVKTASVRMRAGGVLEITIVERMPAMVWQLGNRLYLLDETGVKVAEIPRRATRDDLPLVLGLGAERAVNEAQELLALASPIHQRIRGMVRVGERRWNMVLDQDMTIMLPATGARDALLKVLALDESDTLLSRDLSVIDLRDPNRTILRLNNDALQELRHIRAAGQGEPV